MKTSKKFLGGFLSLLLILTGGFAAAEKLSLEKYISLVEQNNKDILLAQKNTESAMQSVNMARAALLPQAGLSAGYTRNFYEQMQESVVGAYNTGADSEIFPGYTEDVRQNYDNEIMVGVSVSQSLYNPASVGAFRLAKKNRDIQRSAEEFTKSTLVLNAKKLYSQVQLLKSLADVRKEAEETAAAVFQNQEKKYKQGTITELDMRMAEVDWKNSRTSRATAEKNVHLAMMSLKTLAGIPQSQDMELDEEDNGADEIQSDIPFEDALKNRSDYLALESALEAAKIHRQNSFASYLPSVDATFTAGYAQFGGYDGEDDWDAYHTTPVSLGFKITLPLLTGGYRLAENKEANLQIEKAQLELEKKRSEIEQEFESAKLRITEAKLQMEEAKAAEEASERALALAKKSLESGLGTLLTVSQAETQFSLSRLNMKNAAYEYKAACYDFDYAAGR